MADEEDVDPVEDAEEDAKLKFYDYMQALKTEMSKEGALNMKSLGSCLTKMMQESSETIWMDEKSKSSASKSGEKPKNDGKLGQIEDQLEGIVTDVK